MDMQAGARLTTHVLDTQAGCPASGMAVVVSGYDTTTQNFRELNALKTNSNGRTDEPLLTQQQFEQANVFKIRFYTKSYFENRQLSCFYPYVDVLFEVTDRSTHHHVPLIVSPFGYSTYRGS